jgi:hypothetical protein
VTRRAVAGVELTLPSSYNIGPILRLADMIDLLSLVQHFALVATVIVLVALVRTRRAISWLVLVAILYAFAALPRPMASLDVKDGSVVRVDFHSHTNASGDARRSFTVDKNREWHKLGGFDAAYISDHLNFAGAEQALRTNPGRSLPGPILLSAYEGRYLGTYQIFLMSRADSAALITPRHWIREGTLRSGRLPVSVVAIPGPLKDIQAAGRDSAPHYAAIEISDGAPKALSQIDRDRNRIIGIANKLGLSLVSGSNNHGWARVVPAWTLIRIPGWGAMPPDSVGMAIEDALRNPASVRVVERTRPTLSSFGLVLILPAILLQLLRTLTMPERIGWLVLVWTAWVFSRNGILYSRRAV